MNCEKCGQLMEDNVYVVHALDGMTDLMKAEIPKVVWPEYLQDKYVKIYKCQPCNFRVAENFNPPLAESVQALP